MLKGKGSEKKESFAKDAKEKRKDIYGLWMYSLLRRNLKVRNLAFEV
jgi:hypothetical protein